MPPTVVQKKNDPYIYLYVMGEWYCYNPYIEPIGSGAMGDVYLGYRVRTGTQIAVKRVKPCFANNRIIRERARLEASLAFRHPNLVEMIGYCEYAPDHGPIFLLSNFVVGQDIDKYVNGFQDSPLKTEKICNAVCSVLDALEYLHEKGVIHRDIKPSNIMVENGSNVRLMDLGISRMNGGNAFSQFGFIGTPQYSAPEQIKQEEGNKSNPINATTDIYALGITLYELLTGVNPMDCTSDAETLAKQISEPLPENPDIPRKLMKVIWKATDKNQSGRYQSAKEFKQAIRDSLLPDPPFSKRVGAWMSSHPAAIVIITAVILAAVASIIFLIRQ